VPKVTDGPLYRTWRECHDPLERHHDGPEDRCSVGYVRSCVVFGPDGVALDQGPTRCWHRMPSGHARAPLLTTTTGLATLATVAASPAACSPLRRVGREALAGPTPAWQYDHAQLSSSGRRGSRVDRRVGADADAGAVTIVPAFRSAVAGLRVAVRTFSTPSRPVCGQDHHGRLSAVQPLRYSLGMASRLRRALHWLGLVQPDDSVGAVTPLVGTPLRASYVCPTCGALVATSAQERHDTWHQRIGG